MYNITDNPMAGYSPYTAEQQFIIWLENPTFHNKVAYIIKQQVTNELFWQNLWKDDHFMREIAKIKEKVHSAVQVEMRDTVRPEVRALVADLVPQHVATQVLRQLPDILKQNGDYQRIQEDFKARLTEGLSAHTQQTIDAIARDNTHQVITKAYIEQLNAKADRIIGDNTAKHDRFMETARREWGTHLVTVQKNVSDELGSIKDLQTSNQRLCLDLAASRKQIEELESSGTWMKVGLGITVVATAFLGFRLNNIKSIF